VASGAGSGSNKSRNTAALRFGLVACVVIIPVIVKSCARTEKRKSQIMSLIETKFHVSPSGSETSCIEKKSRKDLAGMSAEVAKILDQCLTKENRAMSLGSFFAESETPEKRLCVGTALGESLTFEKIIEVVATAGTDPTDPEVVAFSDSVDAASKKCGVAMAMPGSPPSESSTDSTVNSSSGVTEAPTTVAG
jgi:hypothetical protein